MRLSLILVILFSFTVNASVFSQRTVTLKVHSEFLSNVLIKIKDQTEVSIVFNEDMIKDVKCTSHKFKKTSVKDALDLLLLDTKFYSQKIDGVFVIRKRIVDQQKKYVVHGTVVDKKGEPLPGVTVLIKGTVIGVTTNSNGEFTISVVNKPTTLCFSFIGMKTIEKVLKFDGVPLKVVLNEDIKKIDEVVVNGYYTRNKETMTGSATIIKLEDIKKISPTNIFRAIEAFEPSFQIVENKESGSNPNHIPNILIRGKSSFEGSSNSPLFIMDGYEVSLQKVFDYDIERIKSITILKDVSATAIYGSRASNGVVVIETKVPMMGELSVSYSFNGIIEAPDLSDYNLMNSEQKLKFEKLSGVYDDESLKTQYKKEELYQQRYKEMLRGVDTYWMSKPLQTAFKHTHSLSLGGGNEKSRYGINLNYATQPGVMKESGRDRLGLSFIWTYLVNNKIRIGNNLSVSQISSKNSPYGAFSDYTSINPYERAYNDQGKVQIKLSDESLNPLYNSTLNNKDKTKSTSYTDNFDIEWYVTEQFRMSGRISYTYGNSEATIFKSPNSSEYLDKESAEKGYYANDNNTSSSLDANIVLNYNKIFANKHSLYFSTGMNLRTTSEDSKSFSAQGFLNDNLSNLDFALQYEKGQKPHGKILEDKMIGFFINLGYAYDNRYMMDVSYRTDGSSKFGKKNRFAPFWSLGCSWNIHNENFFIENNWLTRAKIRTSIGYTGTVEFSPYQARTMYLYSLDNMYMYGVGADISALGNENLKWQRQLSYNIGLDLDLCKRLFSLSAEYYYQKTKDLLLDMTIPPSLGFTTYKENLGQMANSGYSISLRSQLLSNSKKEIFWSMVFGTGASFNKVKKISNALAQTNKDANANETTKPTPLIEEGESVDAIKAVRSLGIDPQTGKEIFVKKDGSYTTTWDYKDKVSFGTTTPKFRGTLSSFLSVKGITLNISFNFQTGAKAYNQTLASRVEGLDPTSNGDARALTDRWQKPGDKTFFKGIYLQESTGNLTSRFIQKYNYLKISSLSLGYTLRRALSKKMGFNSLRFSFNMSDLATFSTMKEERGLSYPFARQFTFSLSAQL